jgi:hypothetical protein
MLQQMVHEWCTKRDYLALLLGGLLGFQRFLVFAVIIAVVPLVLLALGIGRLRSAALILG